ncbi:MAG: hypothetical protein QHH26_01530 [Armatimonadota bacterium]|nr:hypothetical protein [Armatimonadota bacterium]
MTNTEYEGAGAEPQETHFTSTSYSNKIRCGACGSPVRNVPTMYENMKIDWRCAKCLRKDKPVLEDQIP